MKKLSAFVFALVICLATSALLATSGQPAAPGEISEAQFAASGPYRDGLYVGRLAAEGGKSALPNVGRWTTDQDRSMFANGYRRGYNDSIARNR